MALYPIDYKSFDLLAGMAESTRQIGVKNAPDQNTVDRVECQYFLDVINAGTGNNITVINERTAFEDLGCATRFGFVIGGPFIVGESEVGGPDILMPTTLVLDVSPLDGTHVIP